MADFIEHPDFDTLCNVLAPRLAQALRNAVAERSAASMALAGGSTPFPLYRRLASEALDWPRVTLLPGDERWVAADHDACNLRAIRAAFDDVDPRFGKLVPDTPGPEPSLETARRTLAETPAPFDACVLGMGADGHFASLFPAAPELDVGLDPAGSEALVIVTPDPMPEDAPFERVSLTLSAIAASRYLVLVLRGRRKREVLESARGADPRDCPVAALLAHNGPPLEIHWSP
ncbi:6-phosphogluconolactonase [Wenzhouxiangella sp. XN201]|uniref:6-phosphogluconolactonase n=1 Tax=Wenzhouxiangella sp. XN201 TaxID=2710755 RepID=UPI0013CCE002|nr:6-phosphogluconolactonase [Wenzhouxiangella sp. XN201]